MSITILQQILVVSCYWKSDVSDKFKLKLVIIYQIKFIMKL